MFPEVRQLMLISGLERVGRVDKVRNKEYAKIVFFKKGEFFVHPVQCFSLFFVFTDFLKVWKKQKKTAKTVKNGESFFTTQIFTLST